MRTRTLVVLALLVVGVGGLALAAFTAGQGTALTTLWVSDTATGAAGNHHVPAAGRIGGSGVVFAPLSGRPGTDECALVALDASSGEERWSYPIPPADCAIHAVADPTLADYDADGTREVIAATTERAVVALHPRTGAVEFRHTLSAYGYTRPVVADLVGDDTPEVVVVDVKGTISVLEPDGDLVWERQLSEFTWGQPVVDDFDGDGEPELAVATGGPGRLFLFEADGSPAWDRAQTYGETITWVTTGDADDDTAVEIVVATLRTGRVSAVDGATGEREWTRQFGSYAAVHAFGDGDGDGEPEVYAVARDGVLRSLDAETGATEWTTTLTTADVQMMPPPALGDVDGDGDPELVAVTNDGVVAVVDPATGALLDTYERESVIYTRPRLADVDGDGDLEVFVMYADGRVVAFDVE